MTGLWRWTKEKTRAAGYFISGKSDTEKLVYEATNDDPWGPANSQMQEIARKTYDYNEYDNVKKAMWEQLGDVDEIRHVQKSLLLLEYLLRNGAESLRGDTRMMLGQIQSLTSLQRYETGEEAALEAVIRKKAADIIQMVNDNEIYQMEREKAKKLTGAVTAVSGNTNDGFSTGMDNFDKYEMPSTKTNNNSRFTKEPSEEEDEELNFNPRANVKSAPKPAPAPVKENTFDPFGQPPAKPTACGGFDPFAQTPAPTKPTSGGGFDPFGAPKPAKPTTGGGFDPFGAPKPAKPTTGGGFDPFAPAPAPAKPTTGGGFDPFAPAPAPAKPTSGGGFDPFGAPKPAKPTTGGGFDPFAPSNPPAPKHQTNPDDFLDFTSSPKPAPVTPQNINPQPIRGQPMKSQPPKSGMSGFDDLVDLDLKGGPKGYGKAQQPRGSGPTLGSGF